MSVKFETVSAGDVLYYCYRQKMGNTTMSALESTRVRVVSIDHEASRAVISCYGREREVGRMYFKTLRRWPPEWVYRPFDGDICHVCWAKKQDGHREHCQHPGAARARKSAAKAEGRS